MFPASFGDDSSKLTSLNISPGIGIDVEIVSFNGILLRESAFDMTYPFLYRKVYSYVDNESVNLWMRSDANRSIF